MEDEDAPRPDDESDDEEDHPPDCVASADFMDEDDAKPRSRAPAVQNPLATHCGEMPTGM